MRPVLSPEEAQRVDARSEVPSDTLMERAGYAVARTAAGLGAGYGKRVAVLAGKGNNGGDGYVAARHLLRRGAQVVVLSHGAPRAGTDAERALRRAQAHGVPVEPWRPPRETERWDLVVDALFGTGFSGRLPDDIVPWTSAGAPVLAVDIPSGVDAATGEVTGDAFTATATVTFHTHKIGHVLGEGPDRSGRLEVVDIGLLGGAPAMSLCEEDDAPRPARPRTGHKWSVGSVVVVGGSPGLTGAALLSARAALAGGAGAVTVMVPSELQAVYASRLPDVMSRGVGESRHFRTEDADEVLTSASRFDVMLLGPGLGLDTGRFVHQIVLRWPGKLVLDADGLNALEAPGPLVARQSPTVITPHAGEFRRLAGDEADLQGVVELAARIQGTVLLKGGPTLVAGPDPWVVDTGGPELATIGTGDVLGGFIAALWARGLDRNTAARSAAYWHGRAGASLARRGTVTAAALADEVRRFAW